MYHSELDDIADQQLASMPEPVRLGHVIAYHRDARHDWQVLLAHGDHARAAAVWRAAALAATCGSGLPSAGMRRLEDLISTAVDPGQLTPSDPAQLAFEMQTPFDAGGHQHWLYHDPKAPSRTRTAIRQRLEHFGGPRFPTLPE